MAEKGEIKVYIDTNILPKVLDRTVDNNQLRALDKICDIEQVNLVTSKKTLEEFLNTKDDKMRIASSCTEQRKVIGFRYELSICKMSICKIASARLICYKILGTTLD